MLYMVINYVQPIFFFWFIIFIERILNAFWNWKKKEWKIFRKLLKLKFLIFFYCCFAKENRKDRRKTIDHEIPLYFVWFVLLIIIRRTIFLRIRNLIAKICALFRGTEVQDRNKCFVKQFDLLFSTCFNWK